MRDVVSEFLKKQPNYPSYAPAVRTDDTIYPGCRTLSMAEVEFIYPHLLLNYVTTNKRHQIPIASSLRDDMAWYAFAIAFEAEKIIREKDGDAVAVEVLDHAITFLYAYQNVDNDTVTQASEFLSTYNTLEEVSFDLMHLMTISNLSVSYRKKGADHYDFIALPRRGFSCVGTSW